MSYIYKDSIFWVDVNKVSPNPFQPRSEFDESKLKELGESIRQYGILQPLVVTRKEETKEDGGLVVSYELIAGERRLRASKLIGLSQVPVIIREVKEGDDLMKLELAIIENIQREDLNPIDRARAFKQLIDVFGFKHTQVATKVGKSREYVSNSIRLLMLPDDVIIALIEKRITEGHARPLLMLIDKPEEQMVLFKEILIKRLTVREAESIARHTAYDKVRKHSALLDPDLLAIEERLTSGLGTRVQIEKRSVGGKITIDFISSDDLAKILDLLEPEAIKSDIAKKPFIDYIPKDERLPEEIPTASEVEASSKVPVTEVTASEEVAPVVSEVKEEASNVSSIEDSVVEAPPVSEEKKDDDNDLYSLKDFTI